MLNLRVNINSIYRRKSLQIDILIDTPSHYCTNIDIWIFLKRKVYIGGKRRSISKCIDWIRFNYRKHVIEKRNILKLSEHIDKLGTVLYLKVNIKSINRWKIPPNRYPYRYSLSLSHFRYFWATPSGVFGLALSWLSGSQGCLSG